MTSTAPKNFYDTLVVLHDELEKKVVSKCQRLLEEIINAEKQAILTQLYKLVEEEWEARLVQSKAIQFRCDTCHKDFSTDQLSCDVNTINTTRGVIYQNADFDGRGGETYQEQQDQEDPLFVPQNCVEQLLIEEGEDIKDIITGDMDDTIINASINMINEPAALIVDSVLGLGNEMAGNYLEVPTTSSSNISYSSSLTNVNKSANRKPLKRKKEDKRRQKGSKLDNPYGHPCLECHYVFKKRWNLKEHMKRHTGERPFACDFCPKRFVTQSNRKSHMNVHRKEIEGDKVS